MSTIPATDSDQVATTRPRVTAIYHPTLAVHDLETAREWFTRVFARPAFRWEDTLDPALLDPAYPRNYSFFFFIKDLHFVVLCPELHATGALAGQTRYRDVPEGMIGIGWYTDDAVAMFERLAEFGFTAHDQKGRAITPDNPPVSPMAPDIHVGFTDPGPAGYRHEFVWLAERHREFYARQADPRLRAGWTLPEVAANDPLRIVRTSHHTFLTSDADRATHLYVDAAGGRVVGGERNPELEADSTFIRLGDTIIEFAVPDAGTPYHGQVASGTDIYTGVTIQVDDLDAAELHLRSVGVARSRPSPDVVAIEPADAFGMQWRFTTATPVTRAG